MLVTFHGLGMLVIKGTIGQIVELEILALFDQLGNFAKPAQEFTDYSHGLPGSRLSGVAEFGNG